MFKLESYITPIILSYVEKYAKNLKAEHSQFSLWGGDAVFSNLDLRLDVLERELNIPFTFVSGHIHELHIHVPWTRLHADPIVITINTIECVLRLPGDEDSSESSVKRPALKKQRITDEKVPPPGYVQSLINKIISNVSIVCNNLILKYVEEDIVLSLNTRSVKLSSCDENWDPSFVELSLPNLILRKVLDVSDLTICLDKRNASGKIECYQEPLLYRCSLKVHVAWIYDSLNAKIPRISRFEMRCPKLKFSITETQMPMLLRLFHLALALYFGKLNPTDSLQAATGNKEYEESENYTNPDNVGGDSWSGWAWNVGTTVGTALLPIYWEDEDEEDLEIQKGLSKFNRVLHLGCYVDHASVDLKLTEISKEKRFFGTTSHKQSFTPYCKFGFHGIFGELSVRGINSVNVRGGINAFETLPLGNCPCGVEEKDREDFYIIGGPHYEENEDKKGSLYLSGSLFDRDRGNEAGIPIEKRRNYDIVWDVHMDEVTEEVMLERSSAFALDYLYYWEIPNDWSSEQLSEVSMDLEYSNLSERALFRTVFGPFLCNVSTGFLHRIDLMREALIYYDYYPYYDINDKNPFISEGSSKLETSLEEEMDLIQNGSIPVRVYQLTAIQPCFVIFAVNHSHIHKQSKPQHTEFILPAAKCSMGYIDLTYTTPMYPFRCAKAISLINEPKPGLLHSSIYASANANLLDVSMQLCHGERSVTLLQPSKLKGGFKRLLFSKYWKKDVLPHWEITFEVNSFKFRFTKPQILLLSYILSKGKLTRFEKETISVIVKDSLTKKLCSIVTSISGTKLIAARTLSVSSLQLVIDEIGINLLPSDSNLGSIPILSREKGNEDFNKTSPGRASIKSGSPSLFVFQFPNDLKNQSLNNTPPIVYCNIAEFYINFDPTLYEWIRYSVCHENKTIGNSLNQSLQQNDEQISATLSSRTENQKKKKKTTDYYSNFLLSIKNWFPSISGAFIQIKAQGVKAFFPSNSLIGVRSVKDAVKKAVSSSNVLLKVSFPNITLENTAHIPVIQQFLTGFPIVLPSSVWNTMKDNLPLKIKFNDFSISDENKNIYFLDPNHLSCTLDLKSNENNRLNLCMHVDASNSFKFRIDSEFLLAFTEVMNGFISCLRTMYPIKIEDEECFDDDESSYTPEPISSIRSQSGLFDSGRLMDESILSSTNVSSNTVIEESNSEICLTYWFQCTVPSISINFHPLNQNSILNLEMEDITASLDVQPHYTKLKSRIMSAFMSKSDGEILLSCGENFSPEIKTTDGNALQILPHSRLFESANFKTQGVFNFTFVRALITNAKWKSFLKKSKTLINNEDEYYDIDDPRYLSEVYIKSSAIDISFCPESLSKYLNIFSKSLSNLKFGGASVEKKKSTSYPIDLWINNNTLPLFHFKSKSIRIFCRSNNPIGPDFQDTILFHIESINVSSNVENALSRLLIRPDLYYLAEQCEVLSVMGSKIEDRQYSANFTGLGIYTGNWNTFVEKSRKSSDIVLKTMEENPALEWNTSELNRQEDEDDEPFFYPMLKQFNLQITYAPAIVYYSSNMSKKIKSRLIAGHSLEINAVSNINVYASLDQIRLCRGIVEEFKESFSTLLMQKKESESGGYSDCSQVTDSGCESTSSLSHPRYKNLKFVPLEVLITGSYISLSLYQFKEGDHAPDSKANSRQVRYTNRKIDILKEQKLIEIDEKQCLELPPLDVSNPSNNESLINEKDQINDGNSLFQMNPLLFVAVSQPHVFISITRSSQKLELSFYDLSLDSSSNEELYAIAKDKHSLPSEADFLNHWIKTRQGDSDPLSGIPPALFTATISDFLISSPKLSINIDRPLRLNINEQNLSRGSEILQLLYLSFNLKPSSSPYSSKSSSSFSTFHVLKLSKIIISTKQILIAHPINNLYAEFFVGLSSLELEVNSQEYEASKIEVDFKNVSIRTQLREVTHRFLNPWSFSISSDLTWAKWKEDPIVYLKLNSKSIEIDIGPNTALALLLAANYYHQKYTSWKEELNHISAVSSNLKSKTSRKYPSPEQHYSDDLRAGAFKYITNVGTKVSDIRPYQVVFTPRTLTWRYPQPRALTGTTIYPVPLLAASDLGRYTSSPDNQVICGLQYWDLSLKSFRTYSEFALSESEVSYLNLPILSDRKRIAVSPIWRVVLNIIAEEEQEEEDTDPSDYVLLEEEVIVTAKSLVSVLKVDSFFSPELMPKFQVSGNVSSLSLRIHNHFHFFSRELIPEFQEFHFYQAFPLDQLIFNIHLNSISFGLDNWNDKSNGSHLLLRLKSQMKITFLDYKFLGINTFLSPFKFQSQVYSFNNSIADISFYSKPLHFRVGHFLHHSLEVSSWVWNEVLKSSIKEPPLVGSCSMPIITNYVICNHSQSHLQFGQVGTDEAICLKPQEIYMYSWKSSKAKKYLHIRMEEHRECGESLGGWSEAFPLVYTEKENIIRKTADPIPNTFIINLTRVRLCLQVTISGLIGTASCLKEPLEIKLVPKKNASSSHPNTEEALLQQRILLSPYTAAPSIIMDPNKIEGIKIRILGIGLAWSGTIPTILNEGRRHSVLVRVPTKEKEHCLTLWCRVLRESYENDSLTRIMYVFSPMYVARSLLPNSMSTYLSGKSLSKPFEVFLPGRDSLVQFDTLGDELQYAISFKVCQELPASEPIQISWGMIEKVRQVQSNKDKEEATASIDDMIRKIPSIRDSNWLISQSFLSVNEQPKTDVQISFVQLHPHLNTLCIEVRPSVLIINELNVTAIFEYEGQTWDIASHSVFVPPLLSSTFSIGLCDDENSSYFCSPMELSNQDWNIRQLMPTILGSIPVEGSVQIKILVREDYVCYLTICSNFDTDRSIRFLRLKPTFNLIKKFPEPLTIASLSMGDEVPCSWNDFSFAGYLVRQNKDNESIPLLYWQVIGSPGQRFLSLSDTNGSKSEWSIPVCLDDFPSECDQRRFIDFPVSDGYKLKDELKISNLPLTMTLHKRDEMFYIVLCSEDRPFLMAHNHLEEHFVTVKQIFKYTEFNKGKQSFSFLTWVEPGHSAYFPLSSGSQSSSFKIEDEEPLFVFASAENISDENIIPSWSEPLVIEPSITEYNIRIPKYGDAKVVIETIGYTTQILIKSLSEEEIHAKDIRARINSSEVTESFKSIEHLQSIKPSIPTRNFYRITTHSPLNLYNSHKSSISSETSSQLEEFQAYTYFEEISFTLSDDAITSDDFLDEFVKLTLDSVSVTMRPRFEKPSFFLDGELAKSIEMCFTIFQIQLDNQMFKSNRFDFGIIAIGKSHGDDEEDEIVEENGVPYRVRTRVKVPISSRSEYIYEELKKNSLVLCNLIFDGNYKSKEMLIKSASLSVQPMFINLEDTFIYKMTEVLASFGKLNIKSPNELDLILASSANIEKYLRLESISIDPICLSVSIRAFVKMYIGVHESPLNFGPFLCSGLSTSSFALGNNIARHYISGTLFKAGWVVGSLDILGSPTGFTRTLGDGVRDLIALPYEGSFRGPWAFISGLVHGSSSLVKHITAGTLTSVTNFASSVSRNLDRLSLDCEHQERNEVSRRSSKPSGLGQGIMYGLSGVGIGILGAIGGIAHHPLQALFESGASPTGLIGGVTRGLAGVVTKPLGGAAEFIALTGQGILRGTGWSRDIRPRSENTIDSISSIEPGELMYSWKILDQGLDWYHTSIVYLLNASEEKDLTSSVTILLTTEAIFLISNDSSSKTRIYSLISLELTKDVDDPNKFSLLYLKSLNIDEEERHKTDRVAQFVLGLSGQSDPMFVRNKIALNEKCVELTFIASPFAIEYFSSLFILAKRQKNKKGFDSL